MRQRATSHVNSVTGGIQSWVVIFILVQQPLILSKYNCSVRDNKRTPLASFSTPYFHQAH